jgi:hypothetical protein
MDPIGGHPLRMYAGEKGFFCREVRQGPAYIDSIRFVRP